MKPPTSTIQPRMHSIMCVDDNAAVVEAVATKLTRAGGFLWKGALSRADQLVETCMRDCPDLLILDVDMPGVDAFRALSDLVQRAPNTRAVVFSGHVRRDLIERSLDAGAWGYVSKNDGEDDLVHVLRRVAAGEMALGPEAKRLYDM
jgi:DNA-binding NarL/FixJ family response regulator